MALGFLLRCQDVRARTPRPVAELTGFAGGSPLPPAEGVLRTGTS